MHHNSNLILDATMVITTVTTALLVQKSKLKLAKLQGLEIYSWQWNVVYVKQGHHIMYYIQKVRTGPRAYVPDALQPVGLFCYPCTILVF
jgi:hypothetical protein